MEMYEYIRYSHYKLGHSIRHINRQIGVDRKTIRKALAGEIPKYRIQKPRQKVVIGEHVDQIRAWLIQDRKAPKKQRHTATRIHERLKFEFGHKGSLSTTIATVREIRLDLDASRKEVFIPSDPLKREGAEMDWGELYLDLRGKRTKVYLFTLRSKFSGKIFARLYPAMVQECFFDGHIRAFAYFGGVFNKIVYDNLKTAVKQVLKGRERIEQESFISFRSHYCYDAQFCTIAKGSEKGGVEGAVGYVRRNFLTPIPKCDSLEEANNYLLEKCLGHETRVLSGQLKSVGELHKLEQDKLIDIPVTVYRNVTIHSAVVDKYLTVRFRRNRYSVPAGYRGKTLELELGLSELRLIYKNKVIARHKREFSYDRWVINPWHYLEALQRKPGAFSSSRILTHMEQNWDPVVKRVYDAQVKKYGEFEGSREFISTLLCFKDRSYEDMIAVLELSLEQKSVAKETIELISETTGEDIINFEEAKVAHIAAIANFSIPEADVSRFDALMEVVNG
ncbi:MAG: IS21 family transposase [Bdellovibrionota bacterium]|jgi:transposase|nr:transposase [Halobacteriovoraceae bacterium]MDP7322062.1 IS21 family transposase [Bacteriovoracaceae bacterium]MEE2670307.1 IS21 family transposase [Bdellovibrionota bacterium]|tara:strand:- start:1010 stop:2527 length:1518 start_codon:yes stop_codon:yes gene_type:complete